MKTNKARWYQNSPTTWILKEPSRDGGAVLAAIEKIHHFKFHWSAGARISFAQTRYAAQRAARKALRECKQ